MMTPTTPSGSSPSGTHKVGPTHAGPSPVGTPATATPRTATTASAPLPPRTGAGPTHPFTGQPAELAGVARTAQGHRAVDDRPDASALERDIDRTRERIGRRVEELEQRLSPGELVDQALGYLKVHGSDMAQTVSRAARDNPLPLIAVGAGLLWLAVASSGSRHRTAAHRTPATRRQGWDTGPDSAGSVSGSLKSTASDVGRRVSSAVAAVGDRIGRISHSADGSAPLTNRVAGSIGDLRDQARHLSQDARQQAAKVGDELADMLERQPLLVGAVGVAIGAALGSLVPVSRIEQESLGDIGKSLSDSASNMASDSYDSLRVQARRTVDDLTRRVAESGRSPS